MSLTPRNVLNEPGENKSQSIMGQPPLPTKLKMLAYGNLIIGPLLALVNFVVVSQSIGYLHRLRAPEGFPELLYINVVIYLIAGMLLVIAGVKLYRNQPSGRAWSLAAAVACLVAVFATTFVGYWMAALLRSGVYPLRPGQMYFSYSRLPVGVGAFSPVYAILMIVILLLPETKAWARGQRFMLAAPADGELPPDVIVGKPTSGWAIASFVCALAPWLWLLPTLASPVLGVIALVKIRRSQGAVRGKTFAVIGIVVSSVILLFLAVLIAGYYLTGDKLIA